MFGASFAVIGFFLQALLYPMQNVDWIYNGALAIFFIEFLSIHSSGMIGGLAQEKQRAIKEGNSINIKIRDNAIFFLIFYGIFTVAISAIFKVWFLPLYFIASTYIKISEVTRLDLPTKQLTNAKFVFIILLFLGTTFLTVYTMSLWTWLFPFPEAVLAARPPNASGIFVETPQTLLVWGVLYFSIHLLINIYILIKPKKLN